MKNEKINQLIASIKEGELKPSAKWRAVGKEMLPWILLALLIAGAAIIFSLLISPVSELDPRVINHLGPARAFRVIGGAVFNLWPVLLILLVLLGLVAFRKTETGYRYRGFFILSCLFLFAIAMGVLAHAGKVNERFEDLLEEGSPGFLRPLAPARNMRVFNAEAGLLVGTITEISSSSLNLSDPWEKVWNVWFEEGTEVEAGVTLVPQARIMVVGERREDGQFDAELIRSFRPNSRRGIIFFPQDPRRPAVPQR